MMKQCTKCGKEKEYKLFHKRALLKNGRMSWCKDCVSEYKKHIQKQKNPNYKPKVIYPKAKNGHKFCRICGIEKPINEFYKNIKAKDKLTYGCKKCVSIKNKKFRTNKERIVRNLTKNETKYCKHCKQHKLIKFFGRDIRAKDGLTSNCKKCNNLIVVEKKINKNSNYKHKNYYNAPLGYKICRKCNQTKLIKYFKKSIYCDNCKKIIYKERTLLKNPNHIFKDDITIKNGYKMCKTCKIKKPISEFYKSTRTKTGLIGSCKECKRKKVIKYKKKTILNYKPRIKDMSKDGYKMCGRCKKNKLAKEFGRHKGTKTGLSSWCKDCAFEHNKNRMHTNFKYKILASLRNRLSKAVRNGKNNMSIRQLTGCSSGFLFVYLMSLFKDDMTIKDLMTGKIHVDHIIPCRLFNLEDRLEQRKCFHFTNLQPLWAADNRNKGGKGNRQLIMDLWNDDNKNLVNYVNKTQMVMRINNNKFITE